jgi:hypothetical protein
MTRVFLPGIGFRQRGVRLVKPAHREAAGRTLTLRDLIASPDGTELAYDLSYADEGGEARAHESILIRHGAHEYDFGGGTVAMWPTDGAWRRAIRSDVSFPATAGPIEVEVAISGLGVWRVAGELAAFGQDTESRDLDASDTRDGITVHLHTVSLSRESTVVEVSASTSAEDTFVEGIGAYSTTRMGPTALTLRDKALRVYREQLHDPRLDDALPQGRQFAVFEPMPEDARELALEIPYVYIQECKEELTFDVPVTTPATLAYGRYRTRVLRTYAAPGSKDVASLPYREPGLGIDIDLGGWQDARRLLAPRLVYVDGANRGLRYTNRFDTRNPEPVQQFEIPMEGAHNAARVKLLGVLVQVHGPWVIKFER